MMKQIRNFIVRLCLVPLALGALCCSPVDAAAATAKASLDELSDRLTWFYQAPSKADFDTIQTEADQLAKEIDAHSGGTSLLVAVAIARISEKNHWPLSKGLFGKRAGEILAGKSRLAQFIADDSQVNPTKLDIWWVSYFATGDTRYLHNLFRYAGLELPKTDMNRTMVIGSATWSAKSNCRQHPDVAAFAGKLVTAKPISKHQAEFLRACAAEADDENGTWLGKDGKPVPQTDAMKSAHGFGGQLLVTPDADWKQKWNTTPSAVPEFRTASRVPYGKPITVLIFYTNPRTDAEGSFRVTCDVKLTRPDGSVPVDQKDIACASGKLRGDPHNTRLANAVIGFVGDKGDPPGIWKVQVTLTDKNRNVSLALKTKFTLIRDGSKADRTGK